MILTFRRENGHMTVTANEKVSQGVLAATIGNRLILARMHGRTEARFHARLREVLHSPPANAPPSTKKPAIVLEIEDEIIE